MKSGLHLNQKLGQQLRLLPMQLKLGKVLELNDEEMLDLIKLTVDENPALTYKDGIADRDATSGESAESDYQDMSDNDVEPLDAHQLNRQTGIKSAVELISRHGAISEPTLFEYVSDQIDRSELDEDASEVARFIAGNLDARGYMTRTKAGITDDMIAQYGIEPSPQTVDNAWEFIRGLEPAGLGAVDLADCLLLQLDRSGAQAATKQLARDIIANHFDDFLNLRVEKIKGILETDATQTEAALKLLKSFNPKPGRMFAADADELLSMHVTPDFAVLPEPYHEDRLAITSLNEMPELAIEESFSDLLDERAGDKAGKPARVTSSEALFVKQRCEEAGDFIELLKMRQNTLFNILRYIVKYQKDFFLTGDFMLLKPMVLKTIAGDTGYDPSVVSRVTSGRYILTLAGIISLKSLFNEKKDDGSADGATSIQLTAEIENLIKEENPASPLTDDRIAAMLTDKGYSIARRTVAKYREKAGIPGARQRKTEARKK